MTIDLNFGRLLELLAESGQLIVVEFQGHGHTADTDRPMTIEALTSDVLALLGGVPYLVEPGKVMIGDHG
jgi:hypothetical protein